MAEYREGFPAHVGGAICTIGQPVVSTWFTEQRDGQEDTAASWTLLVLVGSVILTGLNILPKDREIRQRRSPRSDCWACQSVVAPAVEFKADERVIIGQTNNTQFVDVLV